MKMSKEKRALIAGMIGCLLYVIGDFLFAATGKSQSTESIGLMVKVAYLDMASWRMVVSIICGVLGTALYYIGFHQMWKLLKQRITQPKQQKWVKLFQIAYLTGTVCWGYVHAMFMNVALIFKFTFEKYGDMQAAAEIANKVFYCNAAPLLAGNAGASKEKQYHLKRQILPGISAYETLQRVMPKEEALQTVHGYVERLARTSHKQLAALLHIPGLYHLVPGVFVKSTRSCAAAFWTFD